jgi:hypothetical protein
VLDRLVEDGFFFLSLDEADIQVVRDMKAAAARFLAASESLDAMSRRSMLYLKTSAAGYAEAPELNSFQVHARALLDGPREPSRHTPRSSARHRTHVSCSDG